RMEHPAQVLPDYASKAFNKARRIACKNSDAFEGLSSRQLPTLHEIRALSSYLYAKAGYDVSAVQHLMAHTDPDMTRAYQKGHARKVLRVDMLLPFSVEDDDRTVREEPPRYDAGAPKQRQEIFSENFLTQIPRVA
ncbi:MAG TPA: tyrosine-type recombinase/integrase, partial [Woeseiaceae bacterium]|nr:tyrosine-type recombinase/integrase [Woeseiaceae bacterium]